MISTRNDSKLKMEKVITSNRFLRDGINAVNTGSNFKNDV